MHADRRSSYGRHTPTHDADIPRAPIGEEDVAGLVDRERDIEDVLGRLPRTLARVIDQVRLLFAMLRDYWRGEYREIPWRTVVTAAGAIFYLLNPFDLVPDAIPFAGLVDDAFVITMAVRAIQRDLEAYCRYKGYNPMAYFD